MRKERSVITLTNPIFFMADTFSKTVACIQKLDNIYSQSPTAQALVSNAPAIIQGFNNIKAMTLQQETELKALAINRQNDLARFKEVSSGMMKNLDSIRTHIYSLQATVREYAHLANIDPNAKTVIDYTNRQIDQSISMFNNLAFQILNA